MEISKQFEAVVRQLNVDFTLKGAPIAISEICSVTGLMPALGKRADQLSQLVLGYGLGLNYEDEEGTLLGTRINFDEFTPESLRLLCFLDCLTEIIKMSENQDQIALDELLYD